MQALFARVPSAYLTRYLEPPGVHPPQSHVRNEGTTGARTGLNGRMVSWVGRGGLQRCRGRRQLLMGGGHVVLAILDS